MITYKDIIEANIYGRNLLKVRLAKFFLKLQCSTFESSLSLKNQKKLILDIHLGKNNNLVVLSNKEKIVHIKLMIDSSYKVVLSYFLQIWAVINNKLLVHGGLYVENSKNFIITGEGGVGKTHKILTSCFKDKQPFMGDDLVLLSGNDAFPIIRPLCIYPEHIGIVGLKAIIKKKIKKRSVLILKIKRKLLGYIAALFPSLESLFIESYENEFSISSWAYIPPKELGLEVYSGLVKVSDFITLIRSNNKVNISKEKKDTVQGTIYEFKCFENELDSLIKFFHNLSFFDYVNINIELDEFKCSFK